MTVTASQAHKIIQSDFKIFNVTSTHTEMFSRSAMSCATYFNECV